MLHIDLWWFTYIKCWFSSSQSVKLPEGISLFWIQSQISKENVAWLVVFRPVRGHPTCDLAVAKVLTIPTRFAWALWCTSMCCLQPMATSTRTSTTLSLSLCLSVSLSLSVSVSLSLSIIYIYIYIIFSIWSNWSLQQRWFPYFMVVRIRTSACCF